jgi:hypothetical protein
MYAKCPPCFLPVLTRAQDQNVRISKEEMKSLGREQEGIELPGGGYFASLMVYHQLHCIVRLHLNPQFWMLIDLKETSPSLHIR